jgi:chemotaxis protein methyltransferase CheR
LDPFKDPVSVQGFHKALKAFQRGEYETAWSELQRLPADDPFWPEVYCLRAGVLVQQRHWEEAEVACQQLLAHDPWHADAHLLLGILLQQQGQTEAAIESWRLVVTVQPEQWDAHFRLAESYRDLQAWTPAQREYRHTLNILDSLPVERHKLSLAGLGADQVRQICESSLRRLQWHVGMSAPPEELGR